MLGSGLLWISAVVMLLSTVGLILAAKIVLGFLLAVGPIFIGLFLFDATRGFFDGWLRTTAAFALTPLAACVFGAALVLVLEPFLVVVAAQAAEGEFDMGSIVTVTLIIAVFGIVMSLVLRMATGIASGYVTPQGRRFADLGRAGAEGAPGTAGGRGGAAAPGMARAEMLRTETIAATEAGARRAHEIADAVRPVAPSAQRLDDAYRRMPRPVRRPGGLG
jgi:type IV secretion system protein VirB6